MTLTLAKKKLPGGVECVNYEINLLHYVGVAKRLRAAETAATAHKGDNTPSSPTADYKTLKTV